MKELNKEMEIEKLHAQMRRCNKCHLYKTRTSVVCFGGDYHAKIMMIGEAPGANEDREGEPFSGKTGKLLFEIFREAGFKREHFYITNVLKCRPTKDNAGQIDRQPTMWEIDACYHFLEKQIALLRPKIIVTIGNTALKTLFNTPLSITKIHGRVMGFKQYEQLIPVIPMYHPSYIERNGGHYSKQKREMLEDIRVLIRIIKELVKEKREKKEKENIESYMNA